jgi:hypothetical protein
MWVETLACPKDHRAQASHTYIIAAKGDGAVAVPRQHTLATTVASHERIDAPVGAEEAQLVATPLKPSVRFFNLRRELLALVGGERSDRKFFISLRGLRD